MNNTSSEVLRFRLSSLVPNNNDRQFLWLKLTFGLYIVTFILGCIGNVSVLIVTGFKTIRRRRPHELFILNLAIGDFILIVFFIPFQVYITIGKFYPSVVFCKLIAPLITVAFGVSVFTLTVMAVHRCYAITNPFKPAISTRSVYFWLAAVWVLSILLAVPSILVSTSYLNRCIKLWPSQSLKKSYTLSLFIARFVAPLMTIVYAYVRIAKDLAHTASRRYDLRNGEIRTRTAKYENIKVMKTLTVIVVLFVFCMLPNRLSTIVVVLGDESKPSRIAGHVRQYTSVLTIFHSCVNPIAYGVLSKRVVAWFRLCCRGRSKQRRNNQGDTVNIFTENLPNRNQRSSQNSKKLPLMATPARCKQEEGEEGFLEEKSEERITTV